MLMTGIFYIPSCTDLTEGVVNNLPPETFLSLFPDSIISPQKTRIKITWWGDDPDGLLSGFHFSFDSTNWTTTTLNDSTFQLVIAGNDSTFRFWVAAIDDRGLIDPTPATNLYPVVNSAPSVTFNAGTEISDTSFPVASFAWTGTDPDGNNTIRNYYWALNDTANWHELNSNVTTITLREPDGIIPNSNNRLFLKTKDIAGVYSPVARMPDTNKTWYVRAKVGNILVLDDYSPNISDNSQAILFFKNTLDSAYLNEYSNLDIKIANGANIPKIVNPMFIETLRLFSCIIWYAGRGTSIANNPNFDLAEQTLPYFLASGGKIFFTCGFPNSIEGQGNILNFVPIDSVTQYAEALMNTGTQTIVIDNNYPILESGTLVPDNMRGIYPSAGAHIIYKMPFNP